jgi:hypothetical protein
MSYSLILAMMIGVIAIKRMAFLFAACKIWPNKENPGPDATTNSRPSSALRAVFEFGLRAWH